MSHPRQSSARERTGGRPAHPGHQDTPQTVPIEGYAVIGDMQTCALVSSAGSVDWLCLPRFDSPSCFAALLGTPQHGRWLLAPSLGDDEQVTTTRRYVGSTFVLETTHETPQGVVRVTDSMPTGDDRHDIVRIVEGVRGRVAVRHEWVVRFGYGKVVPWVSRSQGTDGEDVLTAVAGPDLLVLRGDRLPRPEDGTHRDEFEVAEGDRLSFSTTWLPSHLPVPQSVATDDVNRATIDEWQTWADRSSYDGPYRDAVTRSLLVLRLLTDSTTGGIVAAATTSLPEAFGGERNWDYRYCWLRDASLTLDALTSYGFVEETGLWRSWLIRAVAGDPEDLQIMYAVDGARELPERTLDHLPGYEGSTPVRVGNGAVDQRQTDVLGEVMVALASGRAAGLEENERAWAVQCALVDELADHWHEPDNGLWEIRGPQRYFTHSRFMVWAAFDRAVQAVERDGLEADPSRVERWRSVRDAVHAEVLERGYDADRGTFTQHYDTTDVDASLLLMSEVGFLPGDDPRFVGTVKAVEEDLMSHGLLLRYRNDSGVDGLSGTEHPFLACSFWLVAAYARGGRTDDATALMDRLVGLANDVGLLSEEYDPVGRRMAGNMPQAFSHLALIRAAQALEGVTAGSPDPSAG